MDDREGSFVAVRRISQGLERGSVYNPSSGNFITKYFIDINVSTSLILKSFHR